LSRYGLGTRPEPAGPGIPTPGAQCLGPLTAHLSLLADGPETPRLARAAELGLRAVVAGAAPLFAADQSLLTLQPPTLVLSAVKPAEDGDGAIVRVLNPTDDPVEAALEFGLPVGAATSVRLDESPDDRDLRQDGSTLWFGVPAHALRSIRVRWQ
jgi:alpha-mannosidase/mannosylglycerate hydrolase